MGISSRRRGLVKSVASHLAEPRSRRLLGGIARLGQVPLRFAQRMIRGAVVIVYHRVSPVPDVAYEPMHPELFRAHLRLLRDTYAIVTRQELHARLLARASTRGLCVVTFDDGFADFAEHAYPLLEAWSIPVTHFVTGRGLERGLPTWNYRLNRLLQVAQLSANLEISPRVQLLTNAELTDGQRTVERLSASEREALLDAANHRFLLPANPPMLRADDLRRLNPRIVEWGSHTVDHSTLPLCSDVELVRELRDSRAMIADAVGRPPDALAFPNGLYDARSMRASESAGYDASFVVGNRRVLSPSTHEIPRYDLGEHPLDLVGLELSGALQGLRAVTGRQVRT